MSDAEVIPLPDGPRRPTPRRAARPAAPGETAPADGPVGDPPRRRATRAGAGAAPAAPTRAPRARKRPADEPPTEPAPEPAPQPAPQPAPAGEATEGGGPDLAALVAGVEAVVEDALAFLHRRVGGDYEVDDFGFDPDFTDSVLLPALRPLYRHWFRVEVRGLHNVPDTGAALVVANHSGTVALDALMTQVALADDHPAHRRLRLLGASLVFSSPGIGELARRAGATLACAPDAERLLGSGELVGVWPEGYKGVGKPFSERYKLQRFGRGGFVTAALRAGVPIIPCSIVGAEEIYPILGYSKLAARLLGLPYFPLTPTFPWLGPLGMVPLPSKWIIEFGTPVPTDAYPPGAADDPMLVFNLTDQVRETIQSTLYQLLLDRRGVFS